MVFESYRGLPKEAKYLIYSAVLPFIAYGMFYTDLSFFLTSVQGFSIPLMGLIVTVMGISTFAASIPLGIAADKYGRKRLYIVGNVMASAIIAVFALTTNVAVLLAAAVVEGISEAAFAASATRCLRKKRQKIGEQMRIRCLVLCRAVAFGVGSLLIPLVMVFEDVGFTNLGRARAALRDFGDSQLVLNSLLMLRINEPRREKRHGVSWRRMLPHKSKDPLVKYVLQVA